MLASVSVLRPAVLLPPPLPSTRFPIGHDTRNLLEVAAVLTLPLKLGLVDVLHGYRDGSPELVLYEIPAFTGHRSANIMLCQN
jgi:hypothetical protein